MLLWPTNCLVRYPVIILSFLFTKHMNRPDVLVKSGLKMKLLAIAICLFLQASSPVLGKTQQSTTHAPNNIQKQSDTKQQPPNTSPLVESQVQSESAKSHDKNDQGTQSDHQVKVVEFPPVTVKRDEIDWALWFFNFALVAVGLLQWSVLRRQAEIAHKQELQMIEAGNQTKEIIMQMKNTAVRDLRAYVGVSKIKLDLDNMRIPIGLVEIQNFGKTPAYKVRHWTGVGVQPYPPITLPEIPSMEDASVSVIFPQVKNTGSVALKKALPLGAAIGTQELTVYVYGKVTYEDAFGNERYFRFRFVFGGTEEPVFFRESGKVWGAMRPDVEGNEGN